METPVVVAVAAVAAVIGVLLGALARTMWAWSTAPTAFISRSKRATTAGLAVRSAGSTLTATILPSRT